MAIKFSSGRYHPTKQQFGFGSLLSLLISGALFIVAGLYFYNSSKINPDWTRIEGHVTSAQRNYNGGAHNGTYVYLPIVTYEVSNQKHTVLANNGTSIPPITGSQYPVAYNPADPSESKAVSGKGANVAFLALGAIGAFMIVSGTVVYVSNAASKRKLSAARKV